MRLIRMGIPQKLICFFEFANMEMNNGNKDRKGSEDFDEPTNIDREKQREEANKQRKIDEELKEGSHTKKPWEDDARSYKSPQSPQLNPKKKKEQNVDDHDEGKDKE